MSLKENYHIDHKTGIITYTDPHSGVEKQAQITDVLDLFFWLRSREDDLRRVVYNAFPVATARPMQLVNGHYIGCTEDRYAVKVEKARYEQVLREQELYVRQTWLAQKQAANEDKNRRSGNVYTLVRYNAIGQEIIPQEEPEPTIADTPDELVQAHMQKVYKPEWWINRPDNLELGVRLKLP